MSPLAGGSRETKRQGVEYRLMVYNLRSIVAIANCRSVFALCPFGARGDRGAGSCGRRFARRSKRTWRSLGNARAGFGAIAGLIKGTRERFGG
jgi:hypothetical protein